VSLRALTRLIADQTTVGAQVRSLEQQLGLISAWPKLRLMRVY
jgi:hypothetical protein